MTVDVLGHGMHNNIGTVVQRVLDVGAQEGIVDNNHDSVLMGNGSHLADIHQPERRVRRGLDPDEFGLIWPDQLLDIGFDGRRECDMDAMGGSDLGEVAVGATVNVRNGHDVRAGGKGLEDDGGGRGARGEGEGISSVFESSNSLFKVVTVSPSHVSLDRSRVLCRTIKHRRLSPSSYWRHIPVGIRAPGVFVEADGLANACLRKRRRQGYLRERRKIISQGSNAQ